MAGKLYKNFRGKQNNALAMEKQPITRNNRLNSSTIAGYIYLQTRGDIASLHRKILLEMCFRQRSERSLENKISHEFSYSM